MRPGVFEVRARLFWLVSVFSALGQLGGKVLQQIAELAGVHIYCHEHPVYVNSRLTGVYAFEDAELTMREEGVYEDLFSGKRYETKDKKIILPGSEMASKLLLKMD